MPQSREPLQKRGPRAWDAAQEYVSPLANRLQVHAVDDTTNAVYAKHVRTFLIDTKRLQVPFLTQEQRDVALAKYLEHMCYLDLRGFAQGSSTFYGYLHIFPAEREGMKEAARALKGWERLATQGEGGPLAWESVGAILCDMARAGEVWAAISVLVSFDGWLRARDPRFGIRRLETVAEEAGARGLVLDEVVEMPANNLIVVFRRG